MNFKLKKIVAREFLLLIFIFALSLLFFIGIYPYNAYKHKKIQKLSKTLLIDEKQRDSLLLPIKNKESKRAWFWALYQSYFETEEKEVEVWETLLELSNLDLIKDRWERVWSTDQIKFFNIILGVANSTSLQKFIEENRITSTDSLNIRQAKIIQNDISINLKNKKSYENALVSQVYQRELSIKFLIFCFLVFFGLRYLYYSIKWSIKILKQNPNIVSDKKI